MTKSIKHIICLGQCSVDTIFIAQNYPREDSKMEVTNVKTNPSIGGPACVAAVTLKKLGENVKFIGAIGKDIEGKFVNRKLKELKIDSSLSVRSNKTQKAFITINEKTNSRTIFYEKTEATSLKLNNKVLQAIKNSKLLLVDAMFIDDSLKALKVAKENNVPTVIDTGSYKTGITKLLKYCDHIVVPEGFSLTYGRTHNKTIEKLKKYKPHSITITLGSKGSITYSRDNIKKLKTPALKIKEAHIIDTTGAGDVFHGAYAYGILQGWSIGKVIKFAATLAGLNCTNYGGPPRNESVKKALKSTQK